MGWREGLGPVGGERTGGTPAVPAETGVGTREVVGWVKGRVKIRGGEEAEVRNVGGG